MVTKVHGLCSVLIVVIPVPVLSKANWKKMKNIKEEKSKKHHKKPEALNVEARWGKLFSVPMLHITVPELHIKDLLEITDKIIADPDAIDHSSQLAGKIYKGKQLSVPLNYNKKVINFQNFTQKCCEAYIKEVREYDSNASRIWKEFTLNKKKPT